MRLIDSTPHADGHVDDAAATSAVARLVACCDEPHWVSTVVAATVSGSPAVSQAVRATLKLCSPTWLTQPPTTWPTSAGSMPVRSTSSAWTAPSRSAGCMVDSPPLRGRWGCGRHRRSRRLVLADDDAGWSASNTKVRSCSRSSPTPKKSEIDERLCVPLTHSLWARNWNWAASGASFMASSVANRVATSTPLRETGRRWRCRCRWWWSWCVLRLVVVGWLFGWCCG
jgi:hypothetical protein